MFYVYAIYNKSHDKIYIGQTNNLKKRIYEHNDHNNKTHNFTKRFSGSWKLIYQEKFLTREEAKVREKQLKSYQGRQYLKKFIPR